LFPSKEKAVSKMEEEILKIAPDFKRGLLSGDKKEKVIKLLVKKYSWIPAIIPEIPLWDDNFFQNRIEDAVKNPSLEEAIQKIADSKKEKRKIKNNFAGILKQYPKLKGLFLMAQKLTDLKDERDEARRFAYFLMRPLYFEIAARAGLKIDELMTLSPTEIYDFIQKGRLPATEEINRRKKNFIVYISDRKFKIYSDNDAADFSKKYLVSEEKIGKESFSGITASQGNVKGVVRTISNKEDLPKVKEGEILVAITTHPDYLSVMKRAKAIITDEGGLTSHAAIVSREFKIPCIVGTKIATQVLKDGDIVEVDANNGIVRILKSNR
jgi:phosphohistidine swiveling domain-containing protein